MAPKQREIEEKEEIPKSVVDDLAERGLLLMTVPSEYGGAGADAVTAGIAAEEIGRADVTCAVASFFLIPSVWGYIFSKYGKNEAKKTVLPKVAGGKAFLGVATTEPGCGSDMAAAKTVARKEGATTL